MANKLLFALRHQSPLPYFLLANTVHWTHVVFNLRSRPNIKPTSGVGVNCGHKKCEYTQTSASLCEYTQTDKCQSTYRPALLLTLNG